MLYSFLLGMAYGIGGTAFGISIRYIGFSLTYAIAVGLSGVLGTLIPPLVKGTLLTTLSKPGAGMDYSGHRCRHRWASPALVGRPIEGTRSERSADFRDSCR